MPEYKTVNVDTETHEILRKIAFEDNKPINAIIKELVKAEEERRKNGTEK